MSHAPAPDALRTMVSAHAPEADVTEADAVLVALLDQDGPAGHRDIERCPAVTGRAVAVVRVALKLAWERGVLTYTNRAPVWNREQRTFTLASCVCPGLDTTVSREEGTAALTATYLDRYGPVSMRDATRCSALSRRAGEVTRWSNRLRRERRENHFSPLIVRTIQERRRASTL
ncbi:DNA glycosylase AlkZ-like family protein [Nocardiopsis sp. NPDC058631]|uniref:DNA glycosylase AlkZ-like family protein n=1 Tax=Nocardiopsis sp. NPDC058631 TaxID=3346566 RepID=UPI0036635F30